MGRYLSTHCDICYFSFTIIYFLTKDVIQFCYSLLYHYILINKGCIIIIQILRFVLISLLFHYILFNKSWWSLFLFSLFIIYSSLLSDHNNTEMEICLLSLLYHYIFFKHSLCIAIHLSIILLYHYILINTKCHITDSCIIISPLSLYIN